MGAVGCAHHPTPRSGQGLPSTLGSPSSKDRMYLLRKRVQKLKKNQRLR